MHNSLARRIIALSGPRDWAHQSVAAWLAEFPPEECLWIGDRLPHGVALPLLARREQLLGDEYTLAVIDGWAGFDPEQLGAVSGTVRGGGALILLLPEAEQWLSYADPAKERIAPWPHTPHTMPNRFIARTLQLLRNNTAVEWFATHTTLPATLALPRTVPAAVPQRSADQQRAIAAVHHLLAGHRRRPLVLLADRGRGKSTALGMAAAELLQHGLQKIIVTAPHRNAVHSLFTHAACDNDDLRLEFLPPDELLRSLPSCDLLLIDEAAAIPTPLLTQLTHHYARIAFATTVHGYEGTGRGFALRFFKVLDAITPGWQQVELKEPIRWCDGDALEVLINELLLLDAEPAAEEVIASASMASCNYRQLTGGELDGNEPLLRELFGLLVLAHYRTSPLDLRQLLDSPDVTIHLLQENSVLAAALTIREGGFDTELAQEIYLGNRRPRGHLAAQALAFYCGMPEAAQLHGERIMRIAVHPRLQQHGFGSLLLQQIAEHNRNSGCDYLAASFGATAELLRFWRRNGLLPLRIGMGREASSGSHSALVMQPFSAPAQSLFTRMRRRFLAALPLQLSDALRELEAPLVRELLGGERVEQTNSLDSDDWRDLYSFAFGKRGYEACIGAFHKLFALLLANPLLLAPLNGTQQQLLFAKVLQQRPWEEVVASSAASGKGQALEQMREIIRTLILSNDLPTPGGE